MTHSYLFIVCVGVCVWSILVITFLYEIGVALEHCSAIVHDCMLWAKFVTFGGCWRSSGKLSTGSFMCDGIMKRGLARVND